MIIRDVRVGFTGGKGPVCWMIRRLDKSEINHVLIRIVFDNGLNLIFQSHGGKGVHICFFNDLVKAIRSGKVNRYCEKSIEMDEEQKAEFLKRIQKYEARGYDYFLIFLYYLWMRLGFRSSWAKFILGWSSKNRMTCNEAVMGALCGLSKDMPLKQDKKYTPEALLEYLFGESSKEYFEEKEHIPFLSKVIDI